MVTTWISNFILERCLTSPFPFFCCCRFFSIFFIFLQQYLTFLPNVLADYDFNNSPVPTQRIFPSRPIIAQNLKCSKISVCGKTYANKVTPVHLFWAIHKYSKLWTGHKREQFPEGSGKFKRLQLFKQFYCQNTCPISFNEWYWSVC